MVPLFYSAEYLKKPEISRSPMPTSLWHTHHSQSIDIFHFEHLVWDPIRYKFEKQAKKKNIFYI